ncbi:HU family DNA-binding protein [Exiguobacterium sp. s133]|uniref:HU family DNA-binding protein n=1 Tax=Exiguobacterium sp. s133 TaxID=2751213 RepID=UPI001BECBE5C|nr:HU family DNA-binding protein [Exiguobacterium sp. s133]
MNRSEFAEIFAKDIGQDKQVAIELVSLVMERLLKEVLNNGKVTFSNFGAFELKTRKATVRKIPNTGEPVIVPERHTIAFTPSREIKRRVNQRLNKAPGTNV